VLASSLWEIAVKQAICLFALVSLAAIGFVACNKEEAKKDEAAAPAVSDAEKLVGHMESMADLIDKNKDNCDKMAEELSAFAKANGKEISELSKKLKGEKDSEEKYKGRIEKATEKMMGGMMNCADNENVMKAMQEIKAD